MNRRIRAQSTTTAKKSDDGYLRYLKPGALAKLRDSKINARSHHHHRSSAGSQIYLHLPISSTSPTSSPSRSPTPTVAADELAGGVTVTVNDVVLPYFSRCLFGPRFPQRKKLMAAKSMLNGNSNSTSPDSPQSVIDVFGSDFLTAH